MPPHTITAIERQKKNPKRVSIYVDDEFAIGVHIETLAHYGLRKGDSLEEKKLKELERAEELQSAKEKSMRLLGYRARSEKEIRDRLGKKSFNVAVIDETIVALKRSRLLDDAAFARTFAHDAIARKPLGKHLLRRELRQKGIANEIIESVIGEVYDEESEEEFALELTRKYMNKKTGSKKKSTGVQGRMKEKKRLADYLARRGFDWETVSSVLSKVLPEDHKE